MNRLRERFTRPEILNGLRKVLNKKSLLFVVGGVIAGGLLPYIPDSVRAPFSGFGEMGGNYLVGRDGSERSDGHGKTAEVE